MNLKLKTLLFCLSLSPTMSFAFLCPTPANFNQIDFGNTVEEVVSKCGKPDKEEKKTEEPKAPQEWTYYIPQTVATSASQQMQGTLKASAAFDKEGKLINLTVNGIGVGATDVCGSDLTLGATMEQVKSACGTPALVNKQQLPSSGADQGKKILIYTYGTDPAVQLIFEDGLLTAKQ